MDQETLTRALAGLPLGLLQYYPRIGSTNDEALSLAHMQCPDFSLVVADEQTAGRGRLNRRWYTFPGTALAFSLVLLPNATWMQTHELTAETFLPRLTALGTLAVCQALEERYHLAARIKWPNDVLVDRRKLAGVLVESTWEGEQIKAVVLGIGLNIASNSVPSSEEQLFPATSLADCLTASIAEAERLALLRVIIERIREWRGRISGVEFIQAWQTKLAFLDEWIWIVPAQARTDHSSYAVKGRILGLEVDGRLRVEDETGVIRKYIAAEIHLRPLSTD